MFRKNRKKSELKTTEEIVRYIMPKFVDTTNEKVFVICFDSAQKVICSRQLCEGGLIKADIEMKKLAAIVIETNASSVVLVHNHPSAIVKLSTDDVEATEAIYEFLKNMRVMLCDHIIVVQNGEYFSMVKSPNFSHVFYGLADPLI